MLSSIIVFKQTFPTLEIKKKFFNCSFFHYIKAVCTAFLLSSVLLVICLLLRFFFGFTGTDQIEVLDDHLC